MVNMDETRYMISDAAKKVEVEAHVLRYWEEELELPIARTELGHRYYTGENIRIFQNIKELKESGFQLKAIKLLLPEIQKKEVQSTDTIIHLEEKLSQKNTFKEDKPEEVEEEAIMGSRHTDVIESAVTELSINAEKLQQFESIVGGIVARALRENNLELSDVVVKELDCLMKMREEREEERFRRLDETIRAHQRGRNMVAAANEPNSRPSKKKFLFWGK